MAKLPGIEQRPLGRYHMAGLPEPQAAEHGRALGEMASALGRLLIRDEEAQLSEATGTAAQELSELRAKLESTRTVDPDDVPTEIEFEFEQNIFDENGESYEVDKPFVYTDKVADEWWALKADEIIQSHASTITDGEARAKFVEEMTERYFAPGTRAIFKANEARRVARSQANAELQIQTILSTNAPTEVREEQANEIITRQLAMGGDPTYWANVRRGIGPRVDQIDYQNRIDGAQTKSELQDVEDEMWTANHRMSPEQMRTLGTQADKRRSDFDEAEKIFQRENADDLFVELGEGTLTLEKANQALARDEITSEKWNIMRNALTAGGTTKVSNPAILSRWRGEIIKLPYTGTRMRVSEKGRILKQAVQYAAMGLNPNGTPNGVGATISGTDAQKITEEIDKAVNNALTTPEYDNAWQMVKTHTGVKLGMADGMATTMMYGSQPQIDAAIAFKQALDTYMDIYGADADPVGFFNTNKETYVIENFTDPVNQEFIALYPAAEQYMDKRDDGTYNFPAENRDRFIREFTALYNNGGIGAAEANEISSRFRAYYQGQGVPPPDQALMFEADHPLYRQFEE